MGVFDPYIGLALHGGIVLRSVREVEEPMLNALDRPAIARTVIVGAGLEIELRAGLSPEEITITLYHEVLEGAAVAIAHPPATVLEFNEADFESAARRMHEEIGQASPAHLKRMLELFGF